MTAESNAPPSRVVVEGEMFEFTVRRGGIRFSWITGPNPGYGFGSSWPDDVPPTEARIRRMIADFLSQIDPETGYISDD